jgi:charged multivesicular body protein 3
MEEMLEDTLDMDEDEELEEEADAEVDKVLFEVTNGELGEAGSVSSELPVSSAIRYPRGVLIFLQPLQDRLEDEQTDRNMEKYREQLNGLLSS